MAIDQQVASIEAEASASIAAASDEAALEAIRVAELGKKGRVSLLMRELGGMSPEQRQSAGPALNGLKDRLTAAISTRKTDLELAALNKRLETEREDLTLPPRYAVIPDGVLPVPMGVTLLSRVILEGGDEPSYLHTGLASSVLPASPCNILPEIRIRAHRVAIHRLSSAQAAAKVAALKATLTSRALSRWPTRASTSPPSSGMASRQASAVTLNRPSAFPGGGCPGCRTARGSGT